MNLPTLIILLVVILVFMSIIAKAIYNRKKGKCPCACSCPSGFSCSGMCPGCVKGSGELTATPGNAKIMRCFIQLLKNTLHTKV